MPRRIIYVLAAAGLISIASLVIGQALLSFSDDFTRLEADTPEFQGYGDFLHHQNDIFNSTLGVSERISTGDVYDLTLILSGSCKTSSSSGFPRGQIVEMEWRWLRRSATWRSSSSMG